ncbi:unnamed protein product, partial [Fusarium langsethiae]
EWLSTLYDHDPLVEFGKHPTEKHKLADKRMTTASLLSYAAWNGYSLTVGKKETRMVCLPGWFFKKLRASAIEELAAAGVENPFITDSDVLIAWWSKIAVSHLPSGSDKPVTIQIAMSVRKTLEKDLLLPDMPFISNCFAFANLLCPAKDLKERSTGETALQVRTEITEQRTREQVEAYQAMILDSPTNLPIFFGNGNIHQIGYSNWTRAGLFSADFSAVTVKPRDTPLYASYIGNCQVPFKFPEGFIIVGTDMSENTWLCGYRVSGLWEAVEKELEALVDIEDDP